MSGTIQKYDIITEEALKVFSEIVIEFQKIVAEAKKLKSGLKDNGFKQTGNDAEKAKKNLTEYEKTLKKLTRVQEQLKISQSDLGKQVALDNEKLKEQNRLNREAAKEKLGLTKRNVGLRASFLSVAKSIGIYAAAMFGLSRLIQFFTRDLLNLTKRLDSMRFSMRSIITDSNEYAQTIIFLNQTSFNYGQDVLNLTERYIKFRAAAMQVNMSAQETQKIFDSAAKAAAVLGLRTDEVQGVFLALEQMLSKGKVTTEELRRQLGERLPGAFGIMADAIGVTIPELDRMLKAGEIMSNEALPKFADALQKAYGIESLTAVDNLAAAHGRLKNSWIQFVEALKASNTYIATLNFLNDTLSYVQVAFGYTNRMLDIYLRITDEAGDKTRELVDILDDVNLDKLIEDVDVYKKSWVEAMDAVGVRTKDALWMFELYIERRRQLMEDDVATMRKSQLFDINDYKAKLGEAEEEYNLFAATQNETVKAQMKALAGFYKEDQTTYKQFLNNQLKDLAEHTRTSQGLYKVYQAQIDDLGDKATKEQKQELDVRYQNWQNYVTAYGVVSKRLLEMEKTGGTGRDTRLQDAKALNERLIEIKKQGLEIQGAVDGESKFKEMQRELELINYKKELNENLLQYVEENSREYNQIKADSYKLETEAFRTQIEYRKQIEEDYQKQYIEDMKRWNDERVAAIYDSTNEANVAIQKQASQDLFNTKLTNREKLRINTGAALKVLENEYKAQEQIQQLYDEGMDEWEKAQQTKADLEQAYLEKSRDAIVQAEEAKRREIQNTLEFISSAGNQAFDVQAQFNENAMTRAEQRYEREMQLAGDSIDRQLSAKRKYEEEVRKIERRQAIAQKVQGAFNIIINTAEAISKVMAQTGILSAIAVPVIAALGAAQLAAVLAQPLPQFEKGGTVDTDSPIIAGEKGQELMILPSGKQMLTPDKPSILTGVPVGTEIIPNDETTRILAQTAVNKTYDMIDMKQTNSYLKEIRDKESISYQGNYKIVQRKGFYGKYRVR